MSTKVIRRIHKVRKHFENEARLELAKAKGVLESKEAFLESTNQSMMKARENVSVTDIEEISYHQNWMLRMEMVRRNAETEVFHAMREVNKHNQLVVAAATEARVIERVAEVRESTEVLKQMKRSERVLNELGIQGWQRRRTT